MGLGNRLRFENGAAMVSNIRFAVGAPDMRNKLITEGILTAMAQILLTSISQNEEEQQSKMS